MKKSPHRVHIIASQHVRARWDLVWVQPGSCWCQPTQIGNQRFLSHSFSTRLKRVEQRLPCGALWLTASCELPSSFLGTAPSLCWLLPQCALLQKLDQTRWNVRRAPQVWSNSAVLTDIVVLSAGSTAQHTTAIVWFGQHFVFKDRGICYHWPMRNTQSRAGSKKGDNERMWVQWQMPESYHQQCSQVLNIKQLFWKLLERMFTGYQDNIDDFRRKKLWHICTMFDWNKLIDWLTS